MLERLDTLADVGSAYGRFQVMRGEWPQPTEFPYETPEPVVSTMFCAPSYRVEGRLEGVGRRHFAPVGRTFMLFPDHPFVGRGTGGPVRVARCVFDRAVYARLVGPDRELADPLLERGLDLASTTIALLIRRLADEALAPGFATEVMMESLMSALLIECGREILRAPEDGAAETGGLARRHLRAIDDHLDRTEVGAPRIADLAAACGFSSHYFAKLFRRSTGRSLGRYIAEWQMRRARHLLVTTAMPLKEIAYRLGFANAANFSTAFRKEFDQPPGIYRKVFGETTAGRLLD